MQIKGKHITIDGLYFHGCANAYGIKADKEILLVGAVYANTGADYLTVRNCEFNDCPIGINSNGQFGLFTKNYLHDSNRFLSGPGWGPIGILIGNAYNEISYNTCKDYLKVGGTWGADGGFIELDDRYFGNKVHHVKIHHNKSFSNMGFLEVEAQVKGDSISVYYNLSDDFQQFVFFWGGKDSRVENNTVIRTKPSLNGAVNTVFSVKNEGFIFTNNIFIVANGIQVLVTTAYNMGNYGKVVHEHNLYYCADRSTADPCGKTLGKGEKIVNPMLVDINTGDYRPASGSPAIDTGANLGYTLDVDNNPVPVNLVPDIGAFEVQK
jgi:hypothetical protein